MSDLKLEDIFDYKYVGGGYYRKKDVKKGEQAEILHGEQAIRLLFERMKELK